MAGRYDRQIRLWGIDGQTRLEQTVLVIIGMSNIAVEVLESLVAAGIGCFIIFDDEKPTDSLATRSGASGLLEYINEIHPGKPRGFCVQCNDYIPLPKYAQMIKSAVEKSNELVLLSVNVADSYVQQVLRWLNDKGMEPSFRFAVIQAGAYAAFAILGPPRLMLSSGSNDELTLGGDVTSPFKELKAFSERILANGDKKAHAMVPFLCVLVKLCEMFRQEHGENPTRAHAESLREMLRRFRGHINEECLHEAEKHLHYCWRYVQIPGDVSCVIERGPEVWNPNDPQAHVAHALERFVASEKRIPASPQLPDMLSDTSFYVELVAIYRARAAADADTLRQSLSRDAPNEALQLLKEGFRTYSQWRLVEHTPLNTGLEAILLQALQSDENPLGPPEIDTEDPLLASLVGEGSLPSAKSVLLALHSYHRLGYPKFRRPRASDMNDYSITDSEDSTARSLIECGRETLEGLILRDLEFDPRPFGYLTAKHMSATVSALVGGVIATELTKLITRQGHPLQGVFLLDATQGCCHSIPLSSE